MKTDLKVGLFLIYPNEFRPHTAGLRDWPEYSAVNGVKISGDKFEFRPGIFVPLVFF
jgi:hypothetical protein